MVMFALLMPPMISALLLPSRLGNNNVATSFSSQSYCAHYCRRRHHEDVPSTLALHFSAARNNLIDSDNNDEDEDEKLLKRLTEKYRGLGPKLPTAKQQRQQQRLGDLYDSEELRTILNIHQNEIQPRAEENQQKNDSSEESEEEILSIHELVLQEIRGGGGDQSQPPSAPELDSVELVREIEEQEEYSWLTDSIRRKMKNVVAIASDVDGTLIGSGSQSVHPRTKESLMRAVQASLSSSSSEGGSKIKHFFPATGKTRWGALNSLGPEIASLVKQCPGVYIQGLYCIVDDEVIFEKKLNKPAIRAAEKLVAKSQTSIIAYDGDNLYTTNLNELVRDLHITYGEPLSTEIPCIAEHGPGVHKILICDDDLDKLADVRKELEVLAKENGATVTQALPTMLELLPEGCSKALGVEKVCEALGINAPVDLLAMGDAENDVEMLKMAAVGVAVGNGCALAKTAADVVLEETSDQGGAGLAMEVLAGI